MDVKSWVLQKSWDVMLGKRTHGQAASRTSDFSGCCSGCFGPGDLHVHPYGGEIRQTTSRPRPMMRWSLGITLVKAELIHCYDDALNPRPSEQTEPCSDHENEPYAWAGEVNTQDVDRAHQVELPPQKTSSLQKQSRPQSNVWGEPNLRFSFWQERCIQSQGKGESVRNKKRRRKRPHGSRQQLKGTKSLALAIWVVLNA